MTNPATPRRPNPPDPAAEGAAAPEIERQNRTSGSLPAPPDDAERRDLIWQQLTARFDWYDGAANRCRRGYQALKMATLILGGAVTVLAAIGAPAWLTASLAAAIVATEGVQQLFQLHAVWISYRATAEALRQQAFLYAAHVAPYNDPATRRDHLADAIATITTTEITSWAKTMQQHTPANPTVT